MTPLTKPVTRVIATEDGALVVKITREGVYVRAKGQRIEYPPIGWGSLLLQSARLYIGRQEAVKPRRKGKR